MGIFDFLKKRAEETISFIDIGAWLDKQVADKELDQKLARAKSVIINKMIESHKHINALESAGLMNENIPVKAKQVMEGHRRAYVHRLRRFLDDINVPDDFSQIGFYAANFSESLSKLSEETHKNYLILKEFMEAELSRVVKSIKGIEDELVGLQQEIEKEGIELIKDAKIKLKQYQDDLRKKLLLEEEKIKQNKEIETLRERHHKLNNRLNELRQTQEYANFGGMLENKKKYEQRLKEVENELKVIFAELNRPLKKYAHGTLHEKLIDKYLLDPTGALEEDASFVMPELLSRMSRELESLELRENQLEKTMEIINRLNREFFLNKKLEIDRLKELNKKTATNINTSVIALNISELEIMLRSASEKINDAERSLEELNKAHDEINLEYQKQKVHEKVKAISPNINIHD